MEMEKYSLETMVKTAHLYEVSIFQAGADDKDYSLSRQYKSYGAAVNYAMKMSREPSIRLVEVWDLDTDRDYYKEDICASQEYSNGSLYRDGYEIWR